MKRRRHRTESGRNRSLVRVLKVFAALTRTRFGLTFQELLEETECRRRTLYRYLRAFEAAGIRITVTSRLDGERLRRIDHIDGRRLAAA